MAFDGNGNFLRLFNWQQDAANGIDITASRCDGEDSGFAAGLTLCVTRDGQGKMAFDFLPATGATYNLGSAGVTWAGLFVNKATVGPPASGTAITGTAVAGAYGGQFVGSSTVGQSFGLQVRSGTNNTDICVAFNNQANVTNYFVVAGDGGAYLGSPVGATQGAGTLNAATGLLINGVNLYPGVPVNTQNANYTVTAADNGKTIYKSGGAAHIDSIPAGLPVGFTVTFIVLHGASNLTITNNDASGGTQFYWSPSGVSATSRTLAADGVATCTKVAAATWYISGSGLS